MSPDAIVTFIGGPWEGREIPASRLPAPDPTGSRGFTTREDPHTLHYYDPDLQCATRYVFRESVPICVWVGGPFDGLVAAVDEVTTQDGQTALCPYDSNTRFAAYERKGRELTYKGYRYASDVLSEEALEAAKAADRMRDDVGDLPEIKDPFPPPTPEELDVARKMHSIEPSVMLECILDGNNPEPGLIARLRSEFNERRRFFGHPEV